MPKPLFFLELLVASMLPVVAILLVGVVGIHQMGNGNSGVFMVTFILCAIATFCGECLLISSIQRAMVGQFTDVMSVCKDFMAGNRGRRAIPIGSSEVTDLVKIVNELLDHVNQPSAGNAELLLPAGKREDQGEAPLSVQVQQLLEQIRPITKGDLRVQVSLPTGNLGLLARICNALIEEFASSVYVTRDAAEQVMSVSRVMLDRSI